MQSNFRLLYPPGYEKNSHNTMKNFDFIHTLQIDTMIVLINESYLGLQKLSLEDYFTTDTEVLSYRLAIVNDIIGNPYLYEVFCRAINLIRNIHDVSCTMSSDFTVEASLGVIRYLEMYEEIVELFAGGLKGLSPESEGMRFFKEQIESIKESDDYKSLCAELSGMEVRLGTIKSISVGINLDETLRVKDAGLLSVESTLYHEGTIIEKLLKKNPQDSFSLMAPLYPLPKGLTKEELKSINYGVKSALNTIFYKSLHSFEPLIQKYYRSSTSFFVSLLDDIRFLTAGVGFILSMKELGLPMCRPQIAPMQAKKCDLENVYNPALARKSIEQRIVSNSFAFDEKGRFYLVTGPNHGGKSIFAYSIGMAQALFQLGLFVPAESALMSPVSGIYTHFPSSDENNYGKGRLESECSRLGAIMEELTDTDMLLMDETFSSTSGLEAGYIASEVLTGIGAIGCGGMFVTHIHDLTQQIDIYNGHPQNKGKIDNLVAQMDSERDGSRSYKISRTTPDGLSYAKDIAGRYGLHLENIIKNLE